ncbi:hypothetical protein HK102_014010 [Quaeritorhiza haematococci]|nr:hypothetical protein HK102_014010 [Quaeritorhiza haematococci]
MKDQHQAAPWSNLTPVSRSVKNSSFFSKLAGGQNGASSGAKGTTENDVVRSSNVNNTHLPEEKPKDSTLSGSSSISKATAPRLQEPPTSTYTTTSTLSRQDSTSSINSISSVSSIGREGLTPVSRSMKNSSFFSKLQADLADPPPKPEPQHNKKPVSYSSSSLSKLSSRFEVQAVQDMNGNANGDVKSVNQRAWTAKRSLANIDMWSQGVGGASQNPAIDATTPPSVPTTTTTTATTTSVTERPSQQKVSGGTLIQQRTFTLPRPTSTASTVNIGVGWMPSSQKAKTAQTSTPTSFENKAASAGDGKTASSDVEAQPDTAKHVSPSSSLCSPPVEESVAPVLESSITSSIEMKAEEIRNESLGPTIIDNGKPQDAYVEATSKIPATNLVLGTDAEQSVAEDVTKDLESSPAQKGRPVVVEKTLLDDMDKTQNKTTDNTSPDPKQSDPQPQPEDKKPSPSVSNPPISNPRPFGASLRRSKSMNVEKKEPEKDTVTIDWTKPLAEGESTASDLIKAFEKATVTATSSLSRASTTRVPLGRRAPLAGTSFLTRSESLKLKKGEERGVGLEYGPDKTTVQFEEETPKNFGSAALEGAKSVATTETLAVSKSDNVDAAEVPLSVAKDEKVRARVPSEESESISTNKMQPEIVNSSSITKNTVQTVDHAPSEIASETTAMSKPDEAVDEAPAAESSQQTIKNTPGPVTKSAAPTEETQTIDGAEQPPSTTKVTTLRSMFAPEDSALDLEHDARRGHVEKESQQVRNVEEDAAVEVKAEEEPEVVEDHVESEATTKALPIKLEAVVKKSGEGTAVQAGAVLLEMPKVEVGSLFDDDWFTDILKPDNAEEKAPKPDSVEVSDEKDETSIESRIPVVPNDVPVESEDKPYNPTPDNDTEGSADQDPKPAQDAVAPRDSKVQLEDHIDVYSEGDAEEDTANASDAPQLSTSAETAPKSEKSNNGIRSALKAKTHHSGYMSIVVSMPPSQSDMEGSMRDPSMSFVAGDEGPAIVSGLDVSVKRVAQNTQRGRPKKQVRFGKSWKGELEHRKYINADFSADTSPTRVSRYRPKGNAPLEGMLMMRVLKVSDIRRLHDDGHEIEIHTSRNYEKVSSSLVYMPGDQNEAEVNLDWDMEVHDDSPLCIDIQLRRAERCSSESVPRHRLSSSPTRSGKGLIKSSIKLLGALKQKKKHTSAASSSDNNNNGSSLRAGGEMGGSQLSLSSLMSSDSSIAGDTASPYNGTMASQQQSKQAASTLQVASISSAGTSFSDYPSGATFGRLALDTKQLCIDAFGTIVERVWEIKDLKDASNQEARGSAACVARVSLRAMFVPFLQDLEPGLMPHCLTECEEALHQQSGIQRNWHLGQLFQKGGDIETREFVSSIDLSLVESLHYGHHQITFTDFDDIMIDHMLQVLLREASEAVHSPQTPGSEAIQSKKTGIKRVPVGGIRSLGGAGGPSKPSKKSYPPDFTKFGIVFKDCEVIWFGSLCANERSVAENNGVQQVGEEKSESEGIPPPLSNSVAVSSKALRDTVNDLSKWVTCLVDSIKAMMTYDVPPWLLKLETLSKKTRAQ